MELFNKPQIASMNLITGTTRKTYIHIQSFAWGPL